MRDLTTAGGSSRAELPGFELPPSPAIAAIDSAAFEQKARAFSLEFLRRHGPTTGEDLTDAMLAGGINPPRSERNFGPIYQQLAAEDLIEQYGIGRRRKGHGTWGAVIWKITAKGLKS